MDKNRLQEIRERERTASKGPWLDDSDDFGYLIVRPAFRGEYPEVVAGFGDMEDTEQIDHYNARFVAYARKDIPDLLAEVERLQKEVHEAEQMALGVYLDKELQIERLEANQKRLAEALSNLVDYTTGLFWSEKTPDIEQVAEIAEARAALQSIESK